MQRNTNLDALRAIAIFMVLRVHSGFSGHVAQAGWAGVDLFFVLSGFLVSGLLFAGYQKTGRIDFSRFYIRRGLKIWPAFYVLIFTGVVVAILAGVPVPRSRLLSEIFFLQSYFHGLWDITWSLAVEEHFYLILPPLLYFLLRLKSKTPFDSIPYVFLATAIFALVCRFAVGWHQAGTVDLQSYLYPTHLRIDGLMFGVLLSYYYRFKPDVFYRFAAWPGGWLVLTLALGLLWREPVFSRNMHTWGLTVLYLGFGCLVAKAVAYEGPALLRRLSAGLALIGVYSYSIYLWHPFFRDALLSHVHIASRQTWFWAYFIGAILFGIAASKIIEIPVLRFRDRVFPAESHAKPAPQIAAADASLVTD